MSRPLTERQITQADYTMRVIRNVCIVLALLVILMLGGCPHYGVWQQGLAGQAEFNRAEQNRRVKVEEARAALESARLLAEAEVQRARGAAEANKVLADGLGGPEGYLRYLYIQQLGNSEKNERTIIYVPTEAMLPITEAGRTVRTPAPAAAP